MNLLAPQLQPVPGPGARPADGAPAGLPSVPSVPSAASASASASAAYSPRPAAPSAEPPPPSSAHPPQLSASAPARSRAGLATLCTAQARIATPLGPVLLARTAHGLAGLWFDGQKHHPGPLSAPEEPGDPLLAEAALQLRQHLAGTRSAFTLPLDLQHGTQFQRRVWQQLLHIPHGRTCSYGDLARAIGLPQAVRAVGAAVGRNPVSIVVPCHRVLGGGGALTGYAGGLERKQALLALEQRLALHPPVEAA